MRHFDEQLETLRNKLLEMSRLVQSAIRESVHALEAGDESEVQSVYKRESDINRLELEIDEIATNILALDQPVANDLRFVTAAGKINNDLERIGDLAMNIAERSESLIRHPHTAVRTDIPKLAELAESMVGQALEAFVRRDAGAARTVLVSDDAVDALRDAIFNHLIRQMKKSSESVQACVDLMFAARNLERIADHATNIAESVVFMVEGVDVRHHGLRGREELPAGS
ncbi:MAG TPA: phosphate signaling complex protein PhoU [Acidobacteriaceae bacterium]|nr:phosphate signaling complex protein PhoU [Acidobacteriaceae bacterium]